MALAELAPPWTPETTRMPVLTIGGGLRLIPSAPVLGLLHYWSADDLSGVGDGGAVASWTDRIGGVILTQATASKRFTWVANGLNGQPVVRGSAANATIMTATFAQPAQPATLLAVVRTPTTTPTATQHLIDSPGAARRDLFYTSGRQFGAQISVALVSPLVTPGDQAALVGCSYDGAASVLIGDGVRTAGDTGGPTTPTAISVGGNYSSGLGNWDGDIAAILIYGRAL